ncbi:unnamed protein product, partial [Urochloa humidicola]
PFRWPAAAAGSSAGGDFRWPVPLLRMENYRPWRTHVGDGSEIGEGASGAPPKVTSADPPVPQPLRIAAEIGGNRRSQSLLQRTTATTWRNISGHHSSG